MKVLHVGNTANFAYSMVKGLREAGFEADLLLKRNCEPTADPSSVDPQIKNNPPKWIKYWRGSVFEIPKLMKLFKKYDLIHAYSGVPQFIQFFGTPFVSHSLGADLRMVVRKDSISSFLLERAYKKSKKVLFGLPHQYTVFKSLGIEPVFLPNPINGDQYPFIPLVRSNKFRILQFSRQDWGKKGNLLFLKAFKKLVQKFGNSVELTLVSFGQDYKKTLNFIKKNDLDKHVKFKQIMNKSQLMKQFSKTDVVAEHFLAGSYGRGVLESMAYGRPVIHFVDEISFKKFFKVLPPVLNAQTEDQIYSHLSFLKNNKSKSLEIGKKSREWVLANHDEKMVIEKLISCYNNI